MELIKPGYGSENVHFINSFPVWFLTRYVPDSFELKLFIARPRSKAVGAVDVSQDNLPSGAISENIDLFGFGFRDQDYDHAGQFNRGIQQVSELVHESLKS